MRISLLFSGIACVAATFALWGTVLAQSDDSDTIQKRLQKEKDRLEQLRVKIEKQDASLDQVKKRELSILEGLGRLEASLGQKEKELAGYRERIETNQGRIGELNAGIRRAGSTLAEQERVLGRRLRQIYKEGEMFPLKVMFSAENFNDLMQRIKYMEMVTAYDSSLFQNYRRQVMRLEDDKRALEEATQSLSSLETETRGKTIEIQQEKEQKSSFLINLKKEKDLTLQARQELNRSSERLTRLILELEGKLVSGEGLNFEEVKGFLQPPVQGKALNAFGKKRDDEYGAYILYNGINIKVSRGTPVRVVFDGKVLFSGYLEGYGNLVIIGHGNKYHTLYGHLDEALVSVGKSVKKGEVIGRSGDTGSLVGESLYFELRHQGAPIDPDGWLKLAQK